MAINVPRLRRMTFRQSMPLKMRLAGTTGTDKRHDLSAAVVFRIVHRGVLT